MIEQNLPEAEEHFHKARKVYVEGLGPRHIRGVYPLLGLAKLELKRPLEEGGPAPQLAGDPEVGRAKLREEIGIPLDGVVTDGLKALAAAHNVELPLRDPVPGVEYEIRA